MLSKKNQKKVEGWEFVYSETISEMPRYFATVYESYNHFMALVIKWPTHSGKSEPMTPVVYETGVVKTIREAVRLCKEACL